MLADYYVEHQRPQEASAILTKLSEDKDAHAAAQARLAGIDYIQNRRSDAYAKVDAVLKADPKNVQMLILKATVAALGGSPRRGAGGRTGRGRRPIQSHRMRSSCSATVRQARNEAAEAIAAFNEVLTLNPRAVPAQLELARINSVIGKSATAVQLASTLVNADPKNLEARLSLVQALRRHGELPRAARELSPLLEAAPKSDVVQTEAGEVAMAQRDLTAAAKHFDTALALNPDSYDALAGRINVLVAQKNTADAVKRVEARLAKHPKDPATLALAGRTYAIAGDLAKSEALLQESLAADAGYMPAYYYLGQIYVRQKRLPEARQRYEDMVKKQPDNVGAHTMVAMLLQAENKPDEARRGTRRSWRSSPRRSWRPTTWPTWTRRRERTWTSPWIGRGRRSASHPTSRT